MAIQKRKKNFKKRNLKRDKIPIPWMGIDYWESLPTYLKSDYLKWEELYKLYSSFSRVRKPLLFSTFNCSPQMFDKYETEITKILDTWLLLEGIEREELPDDPTRYAGTFDKSYLMAIKIASMARFNQDQIASALEIGSSTWRLWKRSKAVQRAMLEGRERATARVVEAIYRRAVGYEHKEEKIVAFQGNFQIVPIKKHLPPDMKAAELWLMNHHPEWKTSFAPGSTINPDDFTTEFDVRNKYYGGGSDD